MGGGGSRKSGGWAAFDRQQRGVVVDAFDPFPPLRSANSNSNNGNVSSSSSPSPSPSPSPWDWPNNNIPTVSSAAQSHTRNQTSSLPTTSTTSIVNSKSQPKHHSPSPSPSPHVCDSSVACFTSVPIEPEWEEDDDDDVYLTHRKEALRTMRSASRHSKAATNAFLRGDHFSAHQHSLEAHHNYSHAQTLHSKAASQILSARNAQNDACNLDLHGLHAAEALHFLQQHLRRIETHFLDTKLEPSSSSLRHKRPTSIQVITGVGNHSRGQASLPTAVTGFLNENGYHFEELKPGVITIRLKFRISS